MAAQRTLRCEYARGHAAAGVFIGGVDRKTFAAYVAESEFLRSTCRIIKGVPSWSYEDLRRYMHPSQNSDDERTRFFGPPDASAKGVAARRARRGQQTAAIS